MLTQYRYFIAIVDCGGMTAAAARLGVSQPAITRSLQALEFQLDTRLIERGSGGLTAAGKLLLHRARALLAEQRSLLHDVAAVRGDLNAVTYVNGSPMTAIALLPRIVARLAKTDPGVRISVRGDNGTNYRWKRDALLAGDLDVVLTISDPALHDDALVQTPLFEPELKVVVRRGHPSRRSDPDLSDLLAYRWILPPAGSSPRAVVENEFAIRSLAPPRDTIEMSDWRIALDLVRDTDYVTAIPFHPACFQDEFARFDILPIAFGVRPLGITIMTRTLAIERPSTRAFTDAARAVVVEHGD